MQQAETDRHAEPVASSRDEARSTRHERGGGRRSSWPCAVCYTWQTLEAGLVAMQPLGASPGCTRRDNNGSCPYSVLRKRVASGTTTEASATFVVTRSRFAGVSPCVSLLSSPPSFRIWQPSIWSTSP